MKNPVKNRPSVVDPSMRKRKLYLERQTEAPFGLIFFVFLFSFEEKTPPGLSYKANSYCRIVLKMFYEANSSL